jgi:uncharacterized protein (TIGR02246 family)
MAAAGAGPVGGQGTKARIRALEEEWRLASIHSDTAAFNRLMAPDQHAIRTDGLVTTREDRLRAFGSGEVRTQALEYSDMRLRVDGNIAIVTGLATRKDTVDGRSPRDFQYRYTRVWQRRGGRWQVIEFQSTAVSPGNVGGLRRSSNNADLAREIEQRDRIRFQAVQRGDVAALDTLLADDWLASGSTVVTKSEYLTGLKSGTRWYGDIHHDDVRVRGYGDAAIVTGRSSGPYRIDGREMNSSGRFTHIYVKRGGRWVMVGMHNSSIPGGSPPSTADSARRGAPPSGEDAVREIEAADRQLHEQMTPMPSSCRRRPLCATPRSFERYSPPMTRWSVPNCAATRRPSPDCSRTGTRTRAILGPS